MTLFKTRMTVSRVVHKEPKDLPKNLQTQQQFKNECDVNRIVQNAQKGVAPRFLAKGVPQWGDFASVPSLEAAYDSISRAGEAFMNLPSKLRLELDNDPRNITKLTKDQVERYKLGKPQDPNSPSQPAPKAPSRAVKAGQAAPAGTEPADE